MLCGSHTWLYVLPICHSCLFSPQRVACHPAKTALQREEAGETERHSLVHLIVEKKKQPSSTKERTQPPPPKKIYKKTKPEVSGLLLSRVLRNLHHHHHPPPPPPPAPLLLFVPKWLLLVTENTCLLLFGFASPCSNMFTAPGPADRSNIWLLCTAERAHSTYIIHDALRTSARRRETRLRVRLPAANTGTHHETHFISLCLCLGVCRQPSGTNTLSHLSGIMTFYSASLRRNHFLFSSSKLPAGGRGKEVGDFFQLRSVC